MGGDAVIHHGDCLDVMAGMEPESIDAIVTDPPYGLEFMGKEWDRPWAVGASQSVGYAGRDDLRLPAHRDSRNANCRTCGGRMRGAKKCVCSEPKAIAAYDAAVPDAPPAIDVERMARAMAIAADLARRAAPRRGWAKQAASIAHEYAALAPSSAEGEDER